VIVIVATLALALALTVGWLPALAQGEGAAPAEIGAGPLDERALALVGTVEYGEDGVRLYGYLTFVTGLEPALLFVDGEAPGPASARFTFLGEVPAAERTEAGGVVEVAGAGRLTFFLDEAGGARFDDPATFGDGVVIAGAALTVRDILQARPDGLVAVGDARLAQETAEPFSLGGEAYRFGRPGIEQRLRFVGVATTEAPAAAFTGTAAVTARPASQGAATPGGTVLDGAGCGEIGAWVLGARVRIARATGNAAAAGPGGGEAEPSAATLRGLAGEADLLAAAQRRAAVPAEAVAANRLLATALSTTGRGLGLLADAVEAGDEEAVAAARAVLADGEGLLARADEAVGAIAATCEE